MTRSVEENIVQTTMLIEAFGKAGTSRGTGFRFAIMMPENHAIPLLMTNKHVVAAADSLTIHFSVSDSTDYTQKTGIASCRITHDWQKLWIPHPDPSVDLGALSLGLLHRRLQAHGFGGHGVSFTDTDLIDGEALAGLSPVEDILMVGYPISLYDHVHNQPILRRGTTATDPRLAFQGREEFLIDCACWPGSSGSPVLIKTQGIKARGSTVTLGASKMFLAGLLYAGPTHSSTGVVEFNPIPTTSIATVATEQMIHLGNVINSTRIRELIEVAKSPPDGNFLGEMTFTFNLFTAQ